MELDRYDVQIAVAYFLSLCVIASEEFIAAEENGDPAIASRYNFIAMAAMRCHLFNDTDMDTCRDIILSASEIVHMAVDLDRISEESEMQANTLAASGFAESAIASMLDYAIYFDELDEVRSQMIHDICSAAGLDERRALSSMTPAFSAIYKKWS